MSKNCKLSTKESINSLGGEPVFISHHLNSSIHRMKAMRKVSITEKPFSQHIYPIEF